MTHIFQVGNVCSYGHCLVMLDYTFCVSLVMYCVVLLWLSTEQGKHYDKALLFLIY
jgi:hypothetical protein